MVLHSKRSRKQPAGITVITATNRPHFRSNILDNFRRQSWPKKELIVVLNHDACDPDTFFAKDKQSENISVYRLPASKSLGACLNFAAAKAKYGFIAKFDDDDYYAPKYLSEGMRTLVRKKGDVTGKHAFYMYLEENNGLYLARLPHRKRVAGATLLFRKKVWNRVKFANLPAGTDMRFLRHCQNKRFVLVSSSPRNFAAIRRKDQSTHTWKWKTNSRKIRLLRAKLIAHTRNFRPLVKRKRPSS